MVTNVKNVNSKLFKAIAMCICASSSMGAYSESIGILESNLESKLDTRIRTNINSLIDPSRYNLDLDIKLGYSQKPSGQKVPAEEMVEAINNCQKLAAQASADEKARSANSLGALPGLPGASKADSKSIDPRITEMMNQMAIAFVMAQCKAGIANIDTRADERSDSESIEIQNISIDLTVDDNTEPQIRDLIKASIVKTAGVNFDRGDQLNITEFEFDKTQPLAASIFGGNLTEALTKNPWLVLLFLAAIIAIFIFSRILGKKNVAEKDVSSQIQGNHKEQDAIEKASGLMNELVSFTLHSPDLWIAVTSDEDNVHILSDSRSAVYKLRGISGLKRFYGSLSQHAIDQIIKDSSELSDEDVLSAIEALVGIVNNLKNIEKNAKSETPFDFLSKLDVVQVSALFTDLSVKQKAMLLSQLSEELSSRMLSAIEGHERAELLIETAKMTTLDKSEMIALADYLSKISRTLPKINKVSASGLSITGDLLDGLPESEQHAALNLIRESDPHQYNELREKILFFGDIVRVDETELSMVLLEVDPESIALAITVSEDEERKTILGSLPKSFTNRVIQLANTFMKSDSPPDGNKGRLAITKALRKAVLSGAISGDKLKPLEICTQNTNVA